MRRTNETNNSPGGQIQDPDPDMPALFPQMDAAQGESVHLPEVQERKVGRRGWDYSPVTELGLTVWTYYRKRAIARVAWAVRNGRLPKIAPGTACSKCGGQAAVYEHRDYSRPLDVSPACDPCNQKLGPATVNTDNVIDCLRHSLRFMRDESEWGKEE